MRTGGDRRFAVRHTLLLAVGVAAVGLVLLRSLPEILAHGYPLMPPSAGAWALLGGAARQALTGALSLLLGIALLVGWSARRRRPRRAAGRVLGVLAVGTLWAWHGLRFNRYEAGELWRRSVERAGLRIPEALVDGPTLLHNLLLTGAAVVAALLVGWGLGWLLARLRAPRLPRAAAVAGGLLLALLLPLALRPATLGRPYPAGPTLVLISLDAVRADHLGCYGYDRPTSPALDRLAAEGVRFTRAYCQEPWTLTSHMSMLTGLYPDAHALDFGRALPPSVWTVPERLREAGYRTLGTVYDCFVLNPRFGYDAGFDRYEVNGRPAAERVERALDWLLSDDRPAFLFLHLYDPHSDTGALPYEAGAEYRARLGAGSGEGFEAWTEGVGASESLRRVNEEGKVLPDSLREALVDLYDAGIAETDAAVGRLLDGLREAGRLDQTLVLVLADHGEALGEAGHYMHERLMEATLHIPFLLRWPGGEGAGTLREDLVETVDVAPTLLAAAGLPPEAIAQGHDLGAGPTGRRLALHRSGPEHAITTEDGWRLRYRWSEVGPLLESLHRLGDDPSDGPDRLSTEMERVDPWIDALSALHRANEALRRRLAGAPEVEMDVADEELLRSLGYIR